jgi:PspAA-like protein
VIVRIMGEGQWRVSEEVSARLNDLDDQAIAALGEDDEQRLDTVLEEMAALVRSEGAPLAVEELTPSEAVIPPSDLTLEETRLLFEGEGLIPDLPAAD